jgi:hypothetical protein
MYEPLSDTEALQLAALLERATGGLKVQRPAHNTPDCWIEELQWLIEPAYRQIANRPKTGEPPRLPGSGQYV